jgi:hypothetical protein
VAVGGSRPALPMPSRLSSRHPPSGVSEILADIEARPPTVRRIIRRTHARIFRRAPSALCAAARHRLISRSSRGPRGGDTRSGAVGLIAAAALVGSRRLSSAPSTGNLGTLASLPHDPPIYQHRLPFQPLSTPPH